MRELPVVAEVRAAVSVARQAALPATIFLALLFGATDVKPRSMLRVGVMGVMGRVGRVGRVGHGTIGRVGRVGELKKRPIRGDLRSDCHSRSTGTECPVPKHARPAAHICSEQMSAPSPPADIRGMSSAAAPQMLVGIRFPST